MIKDLGTNSYRFSIAWPRIYPTGRKQDGLNQKGLNWYVHFVERLIQEGIKPLGWFSNRCSISDLLLKRSNRIGWMVTVEIDLETYLSNALSLGSTGWFRNWDQWMVRHFWDDRWRVFPLCRCCYWCFGCCRSSWLDHFQRTLCVLLFGLWK